MFLKVFFYMTIFYNWQLHTTNKIQKLMIESGVGFS